MILFLFLLQATPTVPLDSLGTQSPARVQVVARVEALLDGGRTIRLANQRGTVKLAASCPVQCRERTGVDIVVRVTLSRTRTGWRVDTVRRGSWP